MPWKEVLKATRHLHCVFQEETEKGRAQSLEQEGLK